MKLILLNLIVFLSAITLNGQIYNHGEIILEKNAKINTNTEIIIYSIGKINNSGKILLKGNWTNYNNSGVFTVNKGEVLFTGQSQYIKEKSTEFGEISFTNNTNTILDANISIEKKIIFDEGILDLNGHSIRVKNTEPSSITTISGSIISENQNSKITWAINQISDNFIIPFSTKENEQIPFVFDVLEKGSDNVSFNTYPTDVANNPLPENINDLNYNGENVSSIVIDRFWYINTNGSKLEVKMSFTSKDLDGNQIDKNKLSLLYYNGTEWISDTTGRYDGADKNSYSTIINESGWFTLISNKSLNTHDKNDLLEVNALSLFPNPANNIISFELPEDKKIFDIEVRDLLGRKVFCDLSNDKSNIYNLDISNLNNSIYFIIAKQSKTELYFGKFIKI